jgi:hypothetical protein
VRNVALWNFVNDGDSHACARYSEGVLNDALISRDDCDPPAEVRDGLLCVTSDACSCHARRAESSRVRSMSGTCNRT